MKIRMILPYVLTIGVYIFGLFVAVKINHNQTITGGILSLGIIYYTFRFHLAPLKIENGASNKRFKYQFPKNIGDLVAVIFLAIIINLSGLQLILSIGWLINTIK